MNSFPSFRRACRLGKKHRMGRVWVESSAGSLTWQSPFLSTPKGRQEREREREREKGLARNGLVQNPNKYKDGQVFFRRPDLT